MMYFGEGESALSINKYGMILTNLGRILKGNLDDSNNYDRLSYYILNYYSLFKENVISLGDYSFQNSNGETFYISRFENVGINRDNSERRFYTFSCNRANKEEDKSINVYKDESCLDKDKVEIHVEVPKDEYAIEVLNIEKIKNITEYEETKEGKLEMLAEKKTDIFFGAYPSKEQIKNASNNGTEFEYTEKIYAKVENDDYECSVIKIVLDENGKLDVTNEESRKIKDLILTNAIGVGGYDIGNKIIKISQEAAETIANTEISTSYGIINRISKIATGFIYTFSSTDSKYAGCYFETPTVTEITYKDINSNVNSLESERTLSANEGKNIDYAIIKDNIISVSKSDYNELLQSGREITEQDLIMRAKHNIKYPEEYKRFKLDSQLYAYIDNEGNLYSNITILEQLKNYVGDNNFVKIVGDGSTFYILTKFGEVYEVTQENNGNYGYFYKKLNKNTSIYKGDIKDVYVIYKLELDDIVDIYDTCTAKTASGGYYSFKDFASLINVDSDIKSKVQDFQRNDSNFDKDRKYLLASHLKLVKSNGENYITYFRESSSYSGINDYLIEYTAINPGKIVKVDSKDKALGIFSKKENAIKMFESSEKKADLNEENEEYYISVEKDETKEMPKIVDIAEYRDSYLTNMQYYDSTYNKYNVQYFATDFFAKVLAVDENGEIYIYLNYLNDGYLIDTGLNLDYFGPTVNYSLSTTEWTNQDINVEISENTKNEIIQAEIKKDENRRVLSSKGEEEQTINKTLTVGTNGIYNYSVTDAKGRSYSGSLNVENIDKLSPIACRIYLYVSGRNHAHHRRSAHHLEAGRYFIHESACRSGNTSCGRK